MRLHPGVKIAIGPPIADGFYYDFEFPEPISETDLEAIEDEIRREIAEGREWAREEVSREEAIARFEDEGQPYKVELARDAEGDISLYTQGAFTDLCRGPHLQSATPIKAVKLTSLAGAYWRGDEHNTQLTRIYGTAFFSQADLDAHLERLEQARARDHRKLGTQLDLFHSRRALARVAVLAPEGDGALERARGPPPPREPRRGYVEVKTPLIYDKTLGHVGPLGQVPREHVLRPADTRARRRYALKPMNCPGHMLLFGSQLRRYRDLPIRYAESSPLHRDERGGTLHGLSRVTLHHAGRRARLLHGGADPGRDRRLHRLRRLPLRPLRGRRRGPSSRRARRTGSAPTSSGITRRPRSRPRSSGTAATTSSRRARARSTARRSTST